MTVLGIVPCSAKKLPTPAPAWLLYSASPTFSQNFLAAKQDCNMVRILSGRYGLISPDQVIAPYDQRIDPNRAGLAEKIAADIASMRPSLVVSYCPSDYELALRLVPHKRAAEGGIYERAKSLGKRGSLKGNVFPARTLLIWLFSHSGASLSDLRLFCSKSWTNSTTRTCQYTRLLKSPFAKVIDNRVYYRFSLT